MKGLFKGLRCIFENEKEPEIQIGLPTDVKHVAHIGCDGPSTPAPSWMNEFQAASEPPPASPNLNVVSKDLPSGAPSASPIRPPKTKQSRRQTVGSDSPGNPNPKPRRNRNSNSDSPPNETSHARRIKNSILGQDSPSQELNVKKTRKKKGSSGDGPTRPSKTKNKDPSNTAAGLDSGCSDEMCLKPVD